MQNIATRLFIYSSVVFGITGILLVLTTPPGGDGESVPNIILMKILFTTVFIILPSFALSVASKYLNSRA